MKTLDDLMKIVPGLRKFRSLNADMLRRLLDRQKGECTWCGEPVPRGSRTWCGQSCVDTFHARCNPQHQVNLVLRRDGGICQECGRDTVAAEKDFAERWRAEKNNHGTQYRQWGREWDRLAESFGYGRGRWREVDHIVPVIEGGGLCSIDNLRLLCGQCHATATKQLAKKRKVKA